MNYSTPRRRHSSLFDRMENEIKKISKRLSVAKESYRESSAKKKQKFQSFASVEERSVPTARRYRIGVAEQDPIGDHVKSSTAPLRRRLSNYASPSLAQTLNQRIDYQSSPKNTNKIILKLHQENSQLNYKLGHLQSICEQQSYRIGHLKAELNQTSYLLSKQKQQQQKQNCYLTTLLEHYKSKAKKYKRIMRETSEVSMSLDSESAV